MFRSIAPVTNGSSSKLEIQKSAGAAKKNDAESEQYPGYCHRCRGDWDTCFLLDPGRYRFAQLDRIRQQESDCRSQREQRDGVLEGHARQMSVGGPRKCAELRDRE